MWTVAVVVAILIKRHRKELGIVVATVLLLVIFPHFRAQVVMHGHNSPFSFK